MPITATASRARPFPSECALMTRPVFGFGKKIGPGLARVEEFRELCDRGVLKNLDRGNLAPEASVIVTHHADRGQRITAQIEEAVVDANLFQLQQARTRDLPIAFPPRSAGR